MNKIFKVIWSKAKHCYVVASELAKSYSKGGGSRTCRRAAAAILAAAVYTAAGSALAENSGGSEVNGDYIGESQYNYNVNITENVSGSVYGRKEDNTNSEEAVVNISGGTVNSFVYGGYVNYPGSGDAISNSVNISGGTIGSINDAGEVQGGGVTGGYIFYGSGDVATNSININGGHVLDSVYGGHIEGESVNGDDNGNVFSNSVNISGSSTLIGGSVYGGSNGNTDIGVVYSNSIDISGGTIGSINDTGNVYGGYSGSNDVVASNSITISGALTSIKGSVYGGYSSSGKVASNSVNISGGTVNNSVYGGYSYTCVVASNVVNISGGTVNQDVYGGYAITGYGNPVSNLVNISGVSTSIKGSVYGGYVENGTGSASYNLVNISGGTIGYVENGIVYGGNVYGGRSYEGDAASNSVTISGGTVINSIYGGYSETGAAASNTVNIINGKAYAVYGGFSESGEAKDNQVTMTDGEIALDENYIVENTGNLYGGYSFEGYVASNSVNISGGTVKNSVYGGFTSLDGLTASNSVRINNASIKGDVCGGRSFNGSAASNTVNISGALTEIKGHVYGGYIKLGNGSASYNLVTIDDGKIGGDVYGGYAYYYNAASNSVNISGGTIGDLSNSVGNVFGGYSDYGSVASNSVNISGDSTLVNCFVYGGYVSFGNGSASSNIVSLDKGTVGSIYGGFSQSGEAASNSVKISDGKAYGVYGGRAGSGNAVDNNVTLNGGNIAYENQTEHLGYLFGGYSYSGTAASNSVTISGGTVGNNVYGGYVESGSGNVASNSVNVSGGTVNDSVYGGFVNDGTGSAIYNIVNISGGEIDTNVYGGYVKQGSGNAATNTVNISSGVIYSRVYGGYVKDGTGSASYNIVNISGDVTNYGGVYGGRVASGSGDAASNSVNITGGKVYSAFGGFVELGTGNAASNSVNISAGEIDGHVSGGFVESGSGNAASNSVNISGGSIGSIDDEGFVYGGDVHGGYVQLGSGDVVYNSVNIISGTVNQNVYGGYVQLGSGDVVYNSVNISGGTVNSNVFGGWSKKGNSASNSVNISGASTLIKDSIYGGYVNDDTGSASYNIVNISGGTIGTVNIDGVVYGGDVNGGYVLSGNGDAISNSVNISGTSTSIKGFVIGGYAFSGTAASNSVNISDGTLEKDVYGGYLINSSGIAASNSVNVSGGTVNQSVYGGYVEAGEAAAASNSVNISGASTIKYSVYGGYVDYNGSGDVASNSVNISGGTIGSINDAGEVWGGDVFGGYIFLGSGDVASNSVNISDGTVNDSVYGGHIEGESGNRSGNVISNSVNIGGGTVKGSIYGGSNGNTDTGVVASNSVTINDGAIEKNVYGGFSGSYDVVSSNSVNIGGGTVKGSIYGGQSWNGNVASNSVNISGGTVNNFVYGGYSSTRVVASNVVNISGGTVNQDVYGGYAITGYGNPVSNLVNISGVSTLIKGSVYGGYVEDGTGSASYNIVSISGGTVNNSVYGAWSYEGDAASNSVNISGGTVNGYVYGGVASGTGNAASNSVNISGVTVKGSVYGGRSWNGNAASNSVNISGGTIGYIENGNFYGGNVYGGYVATGTGDANYNQVNISDVPVDYVYGGYVATGTGDANYNQVNISDVSVNCVYGGYIAQGTGNAASNSVNISGVTVKGSVYGGHSVSGIATSNSINISGGTVNSWIYGGYSWNSNAASNSVTISGGSVNSDVFGGWSWEGKAASNSVTISGGSVNSVVFGGRSYGEGASSNSVNIRDGSVNGGVYGGDVVNGSGIAASNFVNISGGTVNSVYGGNSNDGNAVTNSVNISGGSVNFVYGGHSNRGNAYENKVNIATGTLKIVYGGYSKSGSVASNSVAISGDTTKINEVYGGYVNSGTGSASYNILNISSGTLNVAYGGYSNGTGDANENQVTMTGGEIVYDGSITNSGNLFGGYSNSGVAASNSVTISDGSIEKNVYCGYSDSGDAVSNSANISGGTVEGYVYGGYVMSGSGEASRNSVTISGGTVDSNVYGGDSYEGTTANNSIIISGGTLKANVFCGASSSGIVASNSVNISGDSTLISGSVYGGYSYHNDATGNSVNMSSGTVNLAVLGGYSKEGTVASNSVKISRGIINDTVYGGCSNYGEVASNSINISGGTVNSNVFGGYSYESNAASNSVKISGDTTQILGNIYGGVASGTGNAYENKVNIATGTLKIVYGGYSESGSVASNSVDISGDTTKINEVYGGYVNSGTGSASYNILNISSGTLNVAYGGYANDSGDANENQVTMTGGEIVYDGSITNSGNLFGGYSELGNAASNSVNISGGTIGYIEDGNVYGGNIYGGWSNLGNVASNSVTISGGTVVGYVYGGHSYSGNAASNSVNISGGTVNESVDGGWSELGNAANNSVNISGGNVKYDVFGGYVNQGTGSASYNLVNISGGTVNQYVYGGWCDSGYAASNSVNISDGTVNGVFGARSESSNTYSNSVNISGGTIGIALGGSSYSDSASNSVNISGGTVEDEVYGGSSDYGVAINNSVNISGNSTSIDCNVYGGYSFSGSVASNSVNISGGTFGSDSKIYAGYVDSSNNSSIKDNGVNISGDVTGLENTEIYGYYFRSGSGTNLGNELHIGRAVDYDDEGKIKRDTDGNIIYKVDENTIWQGKTGDGSVNNKVKQIANFETIALHSVAWSNTLPAIAAESFIYDGNTSLGGNITLDITSLTFAQNNPTGTMTLLQSDTEENFNGIKLKYSDSEAADFIPDSGRIIKSDANKTLQSKGIKFTYDYEQKVSRADSNKKVNFTALNTFKKSELGSMKWSDGGYTFANTDVIDANGLVVSFADNFKVEGAEDKNKGDSLDLLDLSSITGATTNEAIARTKTLTYDKNPTSAASLTLSLSQTDSIETNADKNKVTYTIGTKNVTKATFDKELTWNTSSQPFYDASSDSGYIFSESTVIDAKNLTLSFTDSQKDTLKAEDTMTLISATGISSLNNVDQPDNKTFQLSRTGDLGTKFDGTATGVVLAENSAVKYQISKIETDKITLGSRNWTANAESLPDTWRVKADTVIDANDFSFTSNAVTALASGDTKTLVAGSGIVAGSNIADKTVGIDYIDNSLKLGATAFGKIETITDAVQFKVDSVALDSVDISGWKSTDDVSAVPDVWAANTNGVDITATNFDPELTSGSKTIITATTAAFSDNKIDENIRYKADSFSNDSKNGVTFAGFQEGGVKTTDGGKALTYYAMFNDVTDISLGEMNWGTIRDASAVNYDYANISNGSIDISNLTFTAPENIDAGAVATLLKANNSLSAGENISHSQDFVKAADNGAKFESTLSGSVVRTTAGEIAYKATGTTLNGVDLSQWNSSKEASAVPDGWTANANGVNVTATNFNPTLTTGSKTIITASADMFKDENIDESIRYGINSFENDSENGVTLSGNKTGGVKSSDDGKELKYYAMSKNVTDISLGSMKWGEGRTFNSDGYEFKNLTKIDATELKFTNPEIMSGTMDIVDGTKNLGAGIEVIGGSHKQNFDTALDNKAVVSATLTGEVSVESEKVKYALDGITINSFDLANWDGEKASPVNDSWKLAESATVETDGMSILPGSDEEKQVFILKSDTEGYFANVAINGENAYGKKQNKFTDSDEAGSVVLDIAQEKGVALDNSKTNIIYKLGSKDVTNFKLNTIAWKDGAELLNRDKYNYSKLTSLDTDAFNITFEKPETITVNQTMTLLKANDTLTDIAAVEKSNAYSYSPVSGVTMDAIILSRLEAKSGKVALTAFSNKADKLTFGDVEWLDKGALIDHKTLLNNVSFDGADVDTTKIAFTNKQKLDADMQMTLVSDFGDSVGTITGDKYKVGTAYEGEGSAYLDGSDLKFKIKTGAGLSDETHTTVMSMDAGIAVLTAGSEQIGTAIEGLGNAANIAPDGTATFAAVGGGSARYKTGSHVDTNSWNIALAVGKNLEKKDGTLEYGLFGEYGRGNYTLHMDGVEDAGSGNNRYTGGGLITKWTNSHNVYTEASFRLGNVKENTSNILHDGAGNGYGYDKKAKYKGGHIGFGKKYREDENTELEIYGKFFYNEREGINFAAGADQYSLDKVRSRILRAGFRLASTDRKWNRYGGIAYDHEFGGESTGSVNGMAIRSASIKGGTIRGEFGFRREATKTNPWKTDISLYGFTGKRNGFGGSVAVEYQF